jgi:hypothetical protein
MNRINRMEEGIHAGNVAPPFGAGKPIRNSVLFILFILFILSQFLPILFFVCMVTAKASGRNRSFAHY